MLSGKEVLAGFSGATGAAAVLTSVRLPRSEKASARDWEVAATRGIGSDDADDAAPENQHAKTRK